MKADTMPPPVQEADSSLSYSYWLGTFIIRGSVAPRVALDVLGFGVLATAIVFAIQILQDYFEKPFGVMPAFEAQGGNTISSGYNTNQIWIVPLYVMLFAYPLLSLDRIGMELQNPFSTQRIDFLPLDSMCTSIERNVLELLHDMEDQITAAPSPADVELPPDAELPKQNDKTKANIT